MATVPTQIAALVSVYYMWRNKFTPASILNVGVGKTAPEVYIWRWLLPDAQLLGVDPRWSPRGNWTKKLKLPQITVGVGDGTSTEAMYCGKCRSVKCADPAHVAKTLVRMSTIDEVAKDLPGPLFMWMDIDGSEPDALRGAPKTLARTGWVNVECHEAIYGSAHSESIERLLAAAGFQLEFRHDRCADRLYRNMRLQGAANGNVV